MPTLIQALLAFKTWQGSREELAMVVGKMLGEEKTWQAKALHLPSLAQVIDYRRVGILSPAVGKTFNWRHVVELTVGCILVRFRHKRTEIAARFRELKTEEIIALLQRNLNDPIDLSREIISVVPDSDLLEKMHEALLLLAAGLVAQHKLAKSGEALKHDSAMSQWLRGALSRLAALHVLCGVPVECDGVHALVARCTLPLQSSAWGLALLDLPNFRFHGIRLLDPTTRLPSIECLVMANQINSELDMLEQQAFAQLNSACDQFALRGDEAYSLIREFIVRHPVTTDAERRSFIEKNNLQLAAPFLAQCYEPTQPHHLVSQTLTSCDRCGFPLHRARLEGYLCCPNKLCIKYDSPRQRDAVRNISPDEALIARPHILFYWCGPGRDEIEIYDAAVGLDSQLYPGRDSCDIGIQGSSLGIDVKSHCNPFVLADSLNDDLGRLDLFQRKIVAVNNQAISRFPDYLSILKQECRRNDLEIYSVSALIEKLRAE